MFIKNFNFANLEAYLRIIDNCKSLYKMNLKICVVFIVALFLSLFSFQKAEASHLMGADIGYQCLDPDSNTYLITLNLYRDCAGISAPFSATVNFSSLNCGGINFSETLNTATLQWYDSIWYTM